jgi:phage-related protein
MAESCASRSRKIGGRPITLELPILPELQRVMAVIARHGDTFRAIYTVRFGEVVYVLHVFQKKSKRGIATPKKELELIRKRMKLAEQDHKQWTAPGGQA